MNCPICKGKESLQTRTHRKFLFKILPYSKSYKCYNCESQYINWLKLSIPFKINRPLLNDFKTKKNIN